MFTKAQFEKNEDNNYHTENGIEMAKHFGTEDEQKLMLQIQKDHYVIVKVSRYLLNLSFKNNVEKASLNRSNLKRSNQVFQ